jgi:hypothetical protein
MHIHRMDGWMDAYANVNLQRLPLVVPIVLVAFAHWFALTPMTLLMILPIQL